MLSEPLFEFFSEDEIAAMWLLRRNLGIDVTRSYQFWEALVARITTGRLTDHCCPWDIELGRTRIEVKSSTEFRCRFRNGTRPVFKFAKPKGHAGKLRAHVLVLIGADTQMNVHAWVIPANAVSQCSSITITSPLHRIGSGKGFDGYLCPPSQILPEILRAARCHLAYDHEHHLRNARETRRKGLAVSDMFEAPK